jgi:hypothetical protein
MLVNFSSRPKLKEKRSARNLKIGSIRTIITIVPATMMVFTILLLVVKKKIITVPINVRMRSNVYIV